MSEHTTQEAVTISEVPANCAPQPTFPYALLNMNLAGAETALHLLHVSECMCVRTCM